MHYCHTHKAFLVPLWLSQHPTPIPWPLFPCWSLRSKSEKPPSISMATGPQSSRWPQCAARQLKRKRWAGKWKWVRIGGEPGQQREAASASCLRTDAHACTLSNACAHTHTRTHVHASVHPPCKNNAYPRQSQSISRVRMKRGVRATGEVRHTTDCPLNPPTPQVSNGEKLGEPSARVTNTTIQSKRLTI